VQVGGATRPAGPGRRTPASARTELWATAQPFTSSALARSRPRNVPTPMLVLAALTGERPAGSHAHSPIQSEHCWDRQQTPSTPPKGGVVSRGLSGSEAQWKRLSGLRPRRRSPRHGEKGAALLGPHAPGSPLGSIDTTAVAPALDRPPALPTALAARKGSSTNGATIQNGVGISGQEVPPPRDPPGTSEAHLVDHLIDSRRRRRGTTSH